jgi:hypothetical protein
MLGGVAFLFLQVNEKFVPHHVVDTYIHSYEHIAMFAYRIYVYVCLSVHEKTIMRIIYL